jgi:hypothetical protein
VRPPLVEEAGGIEDAHAHRQHPVLRAESSKLFVLVAEQDQLTAVDLGAARTLGLPVRLGLLIVDEVPDVQRPESIREGVRLGGRLAAGHHAQARAHEALARVIVADAQGLGDGLRVPLQVDHGWRLGRV